MRKLLIKNGRVIDPASGLDKVCDVLVEDGKVRGIGSRVKGQGARRIDAKGMLVVPGLIDMHVHLRDPGRPDKETIASGTRAAALGGFTSICCMANTHPPIDNLAVVKFVRSRAEAEGVVNVYPIGAVTKELKGEVLSEMGLMLEQGAVAFSDDGKPIMRADVLRRALEYASQFDVPLISHCEDANLSSGGSMNEGAVSTQIGLPGIPSLAEEVMVARDILMAEKFGRVHIAHVSSARSVDLIRQAKRKGIPVTCETCPHYFSLTEEAVREYDTNAKVNPPLKTQKDVKAVIKGLADGTIDAIATDHAPHNIEEKDVEFNQASSGIIGLETAVALIITKLVAGKALTIMQVIEKLTINPAKILKLGKGTLQSGSVADITIIDPKAEWTVNPSQFASKSKNTPFTGWKLQGKVMWTIVGGKVVVRNGELVGE
ncbi:MAG: dihydroorotase [Candidatus Margulisbacteria bacterium]|nr:dihydroorotase [Candidatus Margulisiibacteriota bacterium]